MALDLSIVATDILGTLGRFGYISLVRVTKSYDAATMAETETTQVINLYGVDIAAPDNLIDGERIKATDKYFIIDGQNTPTMGDRMRVGGKDYRIISIREHNHAGVPQMFEVFARG